MAIPRYVIPIVAGPVAAYAAVRGIQALALRRLSGKTVVITGGSRGLGLALARRALAHGGRVAICDCLERDVREATRELGNEFGADRVFGSRCDAANAHDVQGFMGGVLGRFGGIDLLISNPRIDHRSPVEFMREEDYADALEAYLWGPLHAVTAALPALKRRRGRIVDLASIGGKVALPQRLPEAAGKFALVGYSEGLSTELAKHGVSATTVCLGRNVSEREASVSPRDEKRPFGEERVTRRILSAAMLRRPQLVFPFSARMLLLAKNLAPRITARALRVAARREPKPAKLVREARLA